MISSSFAFSLNRRKTGNGHARRCRREPRWFPRALIPTILAPPSCTGCRHLLLLLPFLQLARWPPGRRSPTGSWATAFHLETLLKTHRWRIQRPLLSSSFSSPFLLPPQREPESGIDGRKDEIMEARNFREGQLNHLIQYGILQDSQDAWGFVWIFDKENRLGFSVNYLAGFL